MADEPETTPIRNKYARQYADHLEANRKEQAKVIEQIAGLHKHLEQLEVDEAWLSQAMGSLPAAAAAPNGSEVDPTAETELPAPAEAVADTLQTVPQPRQDKPVKAAQSKQPTKKTTAAEATAKKAAAKKAAAKKAAPKEQSGPPLWELILGILLKAPGEPRVAREVSDQLAQGHPGRATSVQAVRNNLERLVKKKRVEKSVQQGNAMYTAYAVAAGAGEQVPEPAAENVPADV
ncbi:hypothetical protein [Streptomyces sp. NPDC058371]|uniref:hypothetical protein n=1 Tax=Streptomyces sp. NPDC058371 TaxID=3346463 RepID=UPI003662634C